MESSLHTFQSIAVIANAAPFTLRWSSCKVPLLRKRAHAMRPIQWQQPAETDRHPQASPPVVKGRGPFMLPRTVVRIGAGVALALALGGASWMARCWSPAPLVLQPALVCVLNDTTSSASMKERVEHLVVMIRDKEDEKKNAKKALNLFVEYKFLRSIDKGLQDSRTVDKGLQLAEELIRLRDWEKAHDICQELMTSRNQHDPRPQFYLAVINMMQAVETILSADPTTTDEDIDEMFKNAIIAWKESIENRKAETKGRK